MYVVTFIVTALWDVVLRVMSENYDKLPSILQVNTMVYLKPYFEKCFIICNIIGVPFILTIGLGIVFVYSDILVPNPPANITTFILISFCSSISQNILFVQLIFYIEFFHEK